MVPSAWMAVVLGVAVGSGSAWAEDAYLIKTKEPAKGDRVLIQEWSILRTQVKGELPDGRTLAKVEKKEKMTEYRQTILDIPEGQKNASRLRRQYDKAEQKVGDKTTILPYQNKTVLIEKTKDGKFRFRIDRGPELAGEDADALDTEFNYTADQWGSQTAFLPKKSVHVGESWKVDPAPLLTTLKHDSLPTKFKFVEAKSEATAKLVRAYRKDGRQFGVVETWIEMPIKELKIGGNTLTVLDGSMIISNTSDFCIDGSVNSGTSVNWVQMDCRAQLDVGAGTKPVLSVKGLSKSHTMWQEIKDSR